MAGKKIPIPGCLVCPHRDHKGAFGQVAYVPVCRASDNRNKEIPHEVVVDRGRMVASMRNSPAYPEWCPLEDDR